MTKEDIIRMAREAGFETDCGPLLAPSASIKVGGLYVGVQPLLERFAALVAAAEREACAKVCDWYVDSSSDHEAGTAMNIQDAIRARGQA